MDSRSGQAAPWSERPPGGAALSLRGAMPPMRGASNSLLGTDGPPRGAGAHLAERHSRSAERTPPCEERATCSVERTRHSEERLVRSINLALIPRSEPSAPRSESPRRAARRIQGCPAAAEMLGRSLRFQARRRRRRHNHSRPRIRQARLRCDPGSTVGAGCPYTLERALAFARWKVL